MVLMRASSDEVSSVRIRLRANTGQRLAVEDERGGIHLFLSLDFLPFLLLSFSHDEGRFCTAAVVAAAVIVIVLNRMTQLDFKK